MKLQLLKALHQIDFGWFPENKSMQVDQKLKGFFKLTTYDKETRKASYWGRLYVDEDQDLLTLDLKDFKENHDFSAESQDGIHARQCLRFIASEGRNHGRVSVRIRERDGANIPVLDGITTFGLVDMFTNVQSKFKLNVVSLG